MWVVYTVVIMLKVLEGRSFRAVLLMTSGVVGVGVLGLPYVMSQSGYLVGFLQLVLITMVMVIIALMYAEITVQTEGKHRFVAYIGRFLGERGRKVATFAFLFSTLGGLTAFVILSGEALSSVTHGALTPFWASITVTVAVALIAFQGLFFVSKIASWAIGFILIFYVALIVAALPSLQVPHMTVIGESWRELLMPYGVLIFSLAGMGVIPEVHDLLGRQVKKLSGAIMVSYAMIFVLYAVFPLAMIGALGDRVSSVALTDLPQIVSAPLATVGTLLGCLSVASIFLVLSWELIATLTIDFKLSKPLAWLTTFGVPLILFFLGVREFIDTIGFVGSIFGGTTGILVILAYEKLKRTRGCEQHKCFRLPTSISMIVGAAFLFGILIEIWYTLT